MPRTKDELVDFYAKQMEAWAKTIIEYYTALLKKNWSRMK